jgi:hypothetical protein
MTGSVLLGLVNIPSITTSGSLLGVKAILFSHPGDFTPVCTTELGEVARRAPEFAARNVKVIGISANGLADHHKWVTDINEVGATVGPTDVQFPIVSGSRCGRILSTETAARSLMKIGKFRFFMTCWMSKMLQIAMQRDSPSRQVCSHSFGSSAVLTVSNQ